MPDSPNTPEGRDPNLATDLHVQATYRLTEALAESENRMRRRIELLSEIVFETDPKGTLIFLNGAWRKATGHPIEECLGSPLSRFVHSGDRAILESVMKDPATPQSVSRPQIRFLRADAGIAWMEISATQLADGGAVGALHDVTREKQAQDELEKVSLVASFTDNLVIITDRDGRTEWVNQAFTRRTGFTLSEMVGRKPGDLLQGPDTDPKSVEYFHAQLAEGRSFDVELLNYTRWGKPYWVSVHISPIRDKEGRVERFVSIQSDSTERRAAEEHTASALREKEVLLKEIHHRVKNNMQVISSLLSLQMDGLADERMRSVFADAQNRISAMALVHEQLYRSTELSRVNFSDYLPDLADNIVSVLGADARLIDFTLQTADVRLGIDTAIPCGLLINELVSNAFKHGFPEGRRGWVRVAMEPVGEGRVRLEVADNGCGIPASINLKETKSLGMQLVHTLVMQLGGTIEVHREGGARFVVEFGEGARV